MKHVERLAAGMSFANSDGKRHNREYQIPIPFKRWPLGKLLVNFACLALAMGALLAWGMVG
jgi:hypothetical protein